MKRSKAKLSKAKQSTNEAKPHRTERDRTERHDERAPKREPIRNNGSQTRTRLEQQLPHGGARAKTSLISCPITQHITQTISPRDRGSA